MPVAMTWREGEGRFLIIERARVMTLSLFPFALFFSSTDAGLSVFFAFGCLSAFFPLESEIKF